MGEPQLYRYRDYVFTGVSDLEKVLDGPMTESTDIKIFLAASGIDNIFFRYGIKPFSEEIEQYLIDRYNTHRQNIDASAKRAESRLQTTLSAMDMYDIHTLGELREYVSGRNFLFTNCGKISWIRWNNVLVQYGLEPMLYGKAYRLQHNLGPIPQSVGESSNKA